MGWFNKKKSEGATEAPMSLPELPQLPELPELEDGPRLPTKPGQQLPTLPPNSFNKRFSQDTIKHAITGKKEGDEVFDPDDFAEDVRMMEKPLKKPRTMELSNMGGGFKKGRKKFEPVFIRIDKFEESLHIFEKAKKQIADLEKMLRDISKLKAKEEEELEAWEKEMQTIKAQIERVDQDIFSKIE